MIRVVIFLLAVSLCGIQQAAAQSFHTAKAKSPEAGTIFIYPERIPLQNGDMFTAERGLMFVPLNRSKSTSDVIAVEFYRFPRSERADQNAPPLFILNGGPGFEGLEADLKNLGTFEQRLQQFLEVSEVVVVGQRGIGSSKPHTQIEMNVPQSDASEAYDADKAMSVFRDGLASERQFWLDQGVDLNGFTVLEAATDVRDVAQALGYEKIAIMGGSFGSHWGMSLMRKHPEIIERAVLHGMEGPDHTWDHPGWLWNVYKRVAEEAEQDDKLKGMIPEGGLIKAVESLVQRASDEPFTVTLSASRDVLIDRYVMQQLARGYTRSLPAWPAEIISMSNGDYKAAAQVVALRAGAQQRQFTTASYWMLDSSSGITARRRAEFEADPALQIIGSTFDWYATGSPVWETDLGDDFRQNFETEIPTVIVHGTWDVSTPYENALELAPYFKDSRFITVKRGSHGALGEAIRSNSEFRRALTKFLATGDMSDLPEGIELPQPQWKIPDLPAGE